MSRRCAVLGSPIEHSLSPTLHRAAYAALGLDWTYDAHRVEESELAGFLAGLGTQWRGLSLTMPLKRVAVGLCSELGEIAGGIGVVNTLLLESDRRLVGENTDVPGFLAAWRAAGIDRPQRVVLLGAGATARSAASALQAIGGVREITVLVRSPERAQGLRSLLGTLGLSARVGRLGGVEVAERVDLVVSTLPPLAADDPLLEAVEALAERAAAVCDVGYQPPTPLLSAGARSGALVVGGLDLLLHQAARQVELMTGLHPAPLDAMRAALPYRSSVT